ncbi:MAG: hypothetical protein ACE5FT_01675 [Candidatus Nanoarchaeia archaeon]
MAQKTGLLLAALVAIVAIVGLVVLLQGNTGATVLTMRGDLGPDRGFPQHEFLRSSFEGNTYCVFEGTQGGCASGVRCNNLYTGDEWCG